MDNCEQVASAIVGVLHQLIRDCSGLVLLVTSCEPLRLSGDEVIGVARRTTVEALANR